MNLIKIIFFYLVFWGTLHQALGNNNNDWQTIRGESGTLIATSLAYAEKIPFPLYNNKQASGWFTSVLTSFHFKRGDWHIGGRIPWINSLVSHPAGASSSIYLIGNPEIFIHSSNISRWYQWGVGLAIPLATGDSNPGSDVLNDKGQQIASSHNSFYSSELYSSGRLSVTPNIMVSRSGYIDLSARAKLPIMLRTGNSKPQGVEITSNFIAMKLALQGRASLEISSMFSLGLRLSTSISIIDMSSFEKNLNKKMLTLSPELSVTFSNFLIATAFNATLGDGSSLGGSVIIR